MDDKKYTSSHKEDLTQYGGKRDGLVKTHHDSLSNAMKYVGKQLEHKGEKPTVANAMKHGMSIDPIYPNQQKNK